MHPSFTQNITTKDCSSKGNKTARVTGLLIKESQEPLRDMTKAEVEEQCLSAYVVMPAALEVAFKEWWQSLKSSDVITIRYSWCS